MRSTKRKNLDANLLLNIGELAVGLATLLGNLLANDIRGLRLELLAEVSHEEHVRVQGTLGCVGVLLALLIGGSLDSGRSVCSHLLLVTDLVLGSESFELLKRMRGGKYDRKARRSRRSEIARWNHKGAWKQTTDRFSEELQR